MSARRPPPWPIFPLSENEIGQGIEKNPVTAKIIGSGIQNLGEPKSCFLKLEGENSNKNHHNCEPLLETYGILGTMLSTCHVLTLSDGCKQVFLQGNY